LKNPKLIRFNRRFEYYYVTNKEKPSAIAEKVPGVEYVSLMDLNGWRKDRPLKPGTLVKLRALEVQLDD
jgi:hypothetical protein